MQLSGFILFCILVLFFQNCHPINNSISDFKPVEKSSMAGNGGGYGGKPGVLFNRYLPGFFCANGIQSPQRIIMQEDGLSVVETVDWANGCQTTTDDFDQTAFFPSPFQNEFVAYQNQIFTLAQSVDAPPPSRLAEVICRDKFSQPSGEIVSFYDSSVEKASIQFYGEYFGENTTEYNSRLFTSESIIYKTGNYELRIALTTNLNGPQHFLQGQLKTESKVADLECVLGGALDTSIFQFKKVFDEAVTNQLFRPEIFKVQPYVSPSSSHDFFLVKKDRMRAPTIVWKDGRIEELEKTLLKDCRACSAVKPNLLNNQFLVSETALTSSIFYIVDIEKQITAKIDLPSDLRVLDSWTAGNFSYFLMINDATQVSSFIRASHTNGNISTLIDKLPTLGTNGLPWVGQSLLNKKHLIIRPGLVTRDTDTNFSILVTTQTGDAKLLELDKMGILPQKYFLNKIHNPWNNLFERSLTNEILLPLEQHSSGQTLSTDIFHLDPDKLQLSLKVTILNRSYRTHLSNGEAVILCEAKSERSCFSIVDAVSPTFLFNLDYRRLEIALPIIPDAPKMVSTSNYVDFVEKLPGVTSEIQKYFGLLPGDKNTFFLTSEDLFYMSRMGSSKIYVQNFRQSHYEEVCREAQASEKYFISFFSTPENKVGMIAFNAKSTAMTLFFVEGKACRKVVEFPLGKWGRLTDYQPNQSGLLVVFKSDQLEGDQQHLIWMPFNGRSPILLNQNFSPLSKVTHIKSENNEPQTILIFGQEANTPGTKIFRFRSL